MSEVLVLVLVLVSQVLVLVLILASLVLVLACPVLVNITASLYRYQFVLLGNRGTCVTDS